MVKKHLAHCPLCGNELEIERAWPYVYLNCKVCSKRFPVSHFCNTLDEDFETALGNFPCDRL